MGSDLLLLRMLVQCLAENISKKKIDDHINEQTKFIKKNVPRANGMYGSFFVMRKFGRL